MKPLFLLMPMLLIFPAIVLSDDSVLNEFVAQSNKYCWKIVVVELREIKLWESETKSLIPLFKTTRYNYDPAKISIESPSLCFGNGKLLVGRNQIAENKGCLALIDLETQKEGILCEAKRIVSPTFSYDNKFIAFLSDPYNEGFSLFVLDRSTGDVQELIGDGAVFNGGYNFSISWSPDSKTLFYSDLTGHINSINVCTRKVNHILNGYVPLCSPKGDKLLFKTSKYKPYTQLVYDFNTGKTSKLRVSLFSTKTMNGIWSPDGRYVLLVQTRPRPFSLDEWGNEVLVYDPESKASASLFTYRGFEYLDCGALGKD